MMVGRVVVSDRKAPTDFSACQNSNISARPEAAVYVLGRSRWSKLYGGLVMHRLGLHVHNKRTNEFWPVVQHRFESMVRPDIGVFSTLWPLGEYSGHLAVMSS